MIKRGRSVKKEAVAGEEMKPYEIFLEMSAFREDVKKFQNEQMFWRHGYKCFAKRLNSGEWSCMISLPLETKEVALRCLKPHGGFTRIVDSPNNGQVILQWHFGHDRCGDFVPYVPSSFERSSSKYFGFKHVRAELVEITNQLSLVYCPLQRYKPLCLP
jgi:hypothetical protein